MINTKRAEAKAGGTVELAKIFGIRPQSVSGWGQNLPKAREFELKVKKPDWFDEKGKLIVRETVDV